MDFRGRRFPVNAGVCVLLCCLLAAACGSPSPDARTAETAQNPAARTAGRVVASNAPGWEAMDPPAGVGQSIVWTGKSLIAVGYGSRTYHGQLQAVAYHPASGDWTELPALTSISDSTNPKLGTDADGRVFLIVGECDENEGYDTPPGACPYARRTAFVLDQVGWKPLALPDSLQNGDGHVGDSTSFVGPSDGAAFFTVQHRIAQVTTDEVIDLGAPPQSGMTDLCAIRTGLVAVRALSDHGDPTDLRVDQMDASGHWTGLEPSAEVATMADHALTGGDVLIPTPSCGPAGQTIFLSQSGGASIAATLTIGSDDLPNWSICQMPPRAVSPFRPVVGDSVDTSWIAGDLSEFGASLIVSCRDGSASITGTSPSPPPVLALRDDDGAVIGLATTEDGTDLSVQVYE